MKIYKVTLEPLDWFFFGGESTFDNSVKTSYIARSNLFPQQTALLGMLRYQLLKQENLLTTNDSKPDQEKVNELIGRESFMMEVEGQSFGKIKELSPVFIERQDKTSQTKTSLFPVPLTYGYQLDFNNHVSVYLSGQEKNLLINVNNGLLDYKTYDNYLKYQDKKGIVLYSSDIFINKMIIGITKNTDYATEDGKNEDDDRFFKREMVRFNNGENDFFRFAFYVCLVDKKLKEDFVYLGAERSCFKMNVEQVDSTDEGLIQLYLNNLPERNADKESIVLLSPTYVADMEKLNELCRFHWSYQMPFRNITRAMKEKGKLNSGVISYYRNNICYNMLCAGSVLFFEEKNRNMIERLLSNRYLQKIGYNYYNSMNL